MAENILTKTFPFPSVLSLKLLVEYWENAIESEKIPFSGQLLQRIRQAPELKESVTDLKVLDKHKQLIDFLMSAVTAPAQTDKELTAATMPFQFTPFYQTELFQRTIDLSSLESSAKVNIPGNDLMVGKSIHACLLILEQFYNVRINFDKPVLFTIKNPANGLDKVYKIEIGRQFFEIVSKRPLKPIDANVIKFLKDKVYDVDLWLQYIRPEDFEFRGFMILRMFDVTEQEMISSIKYDLLEKNAVSRKQTFTTIQHKLRSIFGMPEIRVGLAYFDTDDKIILSTDQDSDCWRSLADNEEADCKCGSYHGSVYERSWMEKRYITVEDLRSYPFKSAVEDALLAKGIRSILLAPLVYEDETIGMLELASQTAGELNPVAAHKVEGILPMFAAAVKRAKEETITEVRAIIQEECTNIHPVVQWRFVEAGKKVLQKRARGESAVFEDIVFKDVYPLFGMADVRNSSLERTLAIQEDLSENIEMVMDVLRKIQEGRKLPILDETLFKTGALLQKIKSGLASGDESTVLDFLKREIHPFITLFEEEPEFRNAIISYKSNLDPAFGVIYKKRKDFESSLGMINSMISNYLIEAQVTAQEMFPHYFEKYQTDGIEYTMYLGSGLTRERKFNRFFLKNFRLWQLLTSCEIEKRMEQLRPQLKTKLDITQLVLVQDQPLSIRFRPDEKQFDVDGAYDIRYEIIKKRIDKATVRGTGERLTQPGRIAVIYNQQKVQEEYKRYFSFLASKQIISSRVEELELEELPGASGLRALRIEVIPALKISLQNSRELLKDIEMAMQLQ